MDTDLMHKGLVELEPGEFLRLRDAKGRHVGVVRGSVWITQDGDPADRVIGSGESFRFDRDGLAIVAPLGGGAKLVLEEGLAPRKAAETELALLDWDRFLDRIPEYERRAHRLRAGAMTDLLRSLSGALKRGWGVLRARLAATLEARRTAHELRGLSDHFLKDIELRRDQIGCATRTLPC